jgi:hypothetical protein
MAEGKQPTEKAFKFTAAERGYIARLTEVGVSAEKQLDAVNAEIKQVVAEARERLGLPADARLVPDLQRNAFVLSAAAAPAPPTPTENATSTVPLNGTAH